MANPCLHRSCCQAHSDIIHPASYPRTQRHLHSHEGAGSTPPFPFGRSDFHTAALPNLNDSYRSCTMGLTQGQCKCSGRTEHPPGTTPFNRSVCYTSTTPNFSSLYQSVPSQRELHVTFPPLLANTRDQTLSLKKHFEGYAYGSPPDVVRFRDTANGQSFSTDATPFDALTSRGTRDVEYFTSSTLRSNGENIQYAPYPHRPYNAERLRVFHPSYIPTGSDVFPTSGIIYQWPSSIAAASNISATHCPAPQVTSYDSVGCLGTLTPCATSLQQQRIQRHQPTNLPSVSRPRWRRVKQEPCLSDADSSDPSISHLFGPMEANPSDFNSFNTRLLVPKEPSFDDVDYSKTATPYLSVKNEPSLEEEPVPPKTSTENETDADLFEKYTYQRDDSSDECQVSGFDAPKASSVSLQHTPETLEPCAAEAIKMQPVGDAGFGEKFQPQEMDRQQTTPNVLPAASDPHEKGKKPKTKKARKPRIKKEKEERTKANPDRIRKNSSSRRRHNPTSLYWCADPTCQASRDRGFHGFRTTEDTRRHLAMHEPPKILCKLPHKEGVIQYEGRRTDHLRE